MAGYYNPLTWNAVSGADGYRILRSLDDGVTYDKYHDVVGLSLNDGYDTDLFAAGNTVTPKGLGALLTVPNLTTTENLNVGGNVSISGNVGFFDTYPIAQQSATTDLGTVLSNYGLRVSGTAYPITTSGVVTLGGLTGNTLIVDTDVFVVNATDNRVGIGTATPNFQCHIVGVTNSTNALFVQNTSDAQAATAFRVSFISTAYMTTYGKYAFTTSAVDMPTQNSDRSLGGAYFNVSTYTDAYNHGILTGFEGCVSQSSSGTLSAAYGAKFYVQATANGPITLAVCCNAYPAFSSGHVVTTWYGMYLGTGTTSGATITSMYGLGIVDYSAGTNNTLLFLGAPTTGNWAIYSSSTKDSSLAGNFGLGQTTFGTSAAKVLAIGNGTAPSTAPADAFQMYSKDIAAGEAAPHFMTEHGDIIKLYQQAHIANPTDLATCITAITSILTTLENSGQLATA